MRALSIVVAAAWLGPAAAAWAAQAYAPVMLVGQPGARRHREEPDTSGAPARLELDITGEPAPVSGTMRRGQVIAAYPVRVADAVVLDAPVKATDGVLPAGLVLSRVEVATPEGHPITIWCEDRHHMFNPFSVDCVQDAEADAPPRLWTGHVLTRKDSLGVVTASPDAPLPPDAVFAHHPAKPEERATGRIGFAYCDGDGVSGPPRFTTAFTPGGDRDWISGRPYTCTLGTWPDPADHSLVKVGELRVKVAPGDPMTFIVIEGLSGRRVLSAAAGRPPLLEARPQAAQAAAPIPPTPQPPRKVSVMEPVGEPEFVASGAVASGGELLRVHARHGITGVLENSVSYKDIFGSHTLAAGHPVYGLPMTNAAAGRPSLVWCALEPNAAGVLHSICLPHDGFAYHWVDATGPFATGFAWSQGAMKASAPSVKVTFEDIKTPLDVSYRFLGWRKDGSAAVRMTVSSGANSKSEQTLELPQQIKGGVVLNVFQTRLSLQPTADGRGAEVKASASPSSETPPG